MKELMRTTNLVSISYIQACLAENSIDSIVLDEHTSAFYVNALMPRRIMVANDDYDAALRILNEQKDHFEDLR